MLIFFFDDKVSIFLVSDHSALPSCRNLNLSFIQKVKYIDWFCFQAAWEEKEMRARRRSLGNIRFIGELYKLKMLTARIMHECVKKLLKTTDEESLECLCR